MSEKETFLRKVAVLCLENAEGYIKDAEILIKKKSGGHAFALAVFAEEELAKGVMYHLCAEGLLGINGKWRKDTLKHERKQGFALGIALVYEQILMVEEAIEFAERKAKGDAVKFSQVLEDKMTDILSEEQKLFVSKRGEAYEHVRYFLEELQRKRERAMYVEVDLQGEKAFCPADFKKSEAEQYLSHVEERVDALKDEMKGKMSFQDKQRAMFLIKKRLSLLDEEAKRKLLEWYGLSIDDLDRFSIAK